MRVRISDCVLVFYHCLSEYVSLSDYLYVCDFFMHESQSVSMGDCKDTKYLCTGMEKRVYDFVSSVILSA